MLITIPLRTGRGLNDRYAHPAQRGKAVKKEREAVQWHLNGKRAPAGPVRVLMVRVSSPSAAGWKPLDRDNLLSSLKGVRDQVAAWLGRDDADESIDWKYAQRAGAKGEWTVEIEVSS